MKAKATAAEKRKQERHSALLSMQKQLEEFAQQLSEAELALTREHVERAKARAEYEKRTLDLYQVPRRQKS